ncbi:cell wall metabolism sensor histidine kinase WalK [Oerskovia sp. Root22]|uniref:sensor histidine kinase n=1 Tax=Oerskovia sp. Root22 TaxID=1736494 RepID=UPI0009E9139E|nr:HAMP domain-containing sensor histidine kinase [Oerskovia sp. Root22]
MSTPSSGRPVGASGGALPPVPPPPPSGPTTSRPSSAPRTPGAARPGTQAPSSGTDAGSGGSSGAGGRGPAAPDSPPVPAPDEPRPYGRTVPTENWGWFARVPLRARLVAIIALLLAAGLGIAALATTTVVARYLVGQVDQQLDLTASAVADETFRGNASRSTLPSEYYVLIRWDNGAETPKYWDKAVERSGAPQIPTFMAQEMATRTGKPFTVTSAGGTTPAEWRVVPYPVISKLTGETVGTAYVALPLTGIHETVKVLGRTLAVSALGIALIGGAVAYLAVQRALRPLREIEETAADIAGGDLTRRIRPAPPSTEVGSLAASLNTMLNHIERAFAASEASEARMRRFVSDASHELRTPLATVKGYGELYRMGALTTPEQMDDTMRRIEDSATRMGTLVNDLLALARLDEGRPIRHEPVNLAALARDSAGDLHALDPTRPVRVVSLGGSGDAPEELTVIGDEDRLRQVLANLIGNVSQHTPAGTPVEIALGTQEPQDAGDDPLAVLEVRDHGPGITPEQAAHVFERFYRADSSRNRASGGSGLGMAIVAAIVGAHQGHISVAPTQGGGLTVHVELPTQGYDDGSSPDRT